jgi:ligand-binding sensor domain-containing protein/signal transduction histidine kinase/DNA-binding response OmpR family regulator
MLFCKDVIGQSQSYNFKHISYKEGLVQSPISNFLQDSKGFIWFGTLKGLNRFDGYEFKTFRYNDNDKKSLINNRVNIIFQDSRQNLWIGTSNGLCLYDRDSETFRGIDVLEIKGGRNYISSITEDKHGNIWVGTFAGIRKLNRRTKKLEELSHAGSLRYDAIFSLFIDNDNQIWAGSKRGLKKIDPQTGKVLLLPAFFDPVTSSNNINVLVTRQDNQGNLWFGTESAGVFKYLKDAGRLIRYNFSNTDPNSIASNWIKDILVYDQHRIWFGTRSGISILDTGTGKFTTIAHDPQNGNSLSDNAVWCFMKDRASCIWVGTFAGGINFYYEGNSNFRNIGEKVGHELGLNHVLVNAVAEDPDKSLWVGTFGGGLNHLDRSTGKSEYYSIRSIHQGRAANGVKSLALSSSDNLWVGTLDGLSLFSRKSKTFRYFNFPVSDGKLSENLINTLLADESGVWVGTNGGGLRYVLPDGVSTIHLKKGSGNLQLPAASISDNFVTAMVKDQKRNLWIGTQNGLDYYDLKLRKVTRIYRKVRKTKFQLSNNNITALFYDAKDRLWVGTEGGGLNYFDEKTQRFYSISKNIGLGDNVIHAIVEDRQQNLWLSTDQGLFKLRFKNFSVPFSKQDLQISGYTANDGLISNQFSGNAGKMLSTGEIIFGGINGLSIFKPDKIVRNSFSPRVALTQLLINNKEVKISSDTILLNYDQSNLSLRYSALNFINSENNRYAYRLEGLPNGDGWQEAGTERVVNFANLSPGKYNFKVKAANNDGLWGAPLSILQIQISPPWWRTVWAYLGEALLLVTILIVITNFLRNRSLLRRNLELEKENRLRQQELYQLKLDFFTNISHEIRTPLTLILGPLEKLINREGRTKIGRELTMIKSNAERLMKLVTELLDFRKAEEGHLSIRFSKQDLVIFCAEIYKSFEGMAADKEIRFEFDAPPGEILVYFERHQLAKVIFNLLSNAFKFSDANATITFAVSINPSVEQEIEIAVSNTGKYIPEEIQQQLFDSFFQSEETHTHQPGTGVGLALAKSIVELHKGRISVQSIYGDPALTTFTVCLRSGRAHVTEQEITDTAFLNKQSFPSPVADIKAKLPGNAEAAEDDDAWKGVKLPKDNRMQEFDEVPGNTDLVSKKTYTILIAEDNPEVRRLLSETLAEDYDVLEFENGNEALNFMKTSLPDLILSDVMMPGIDGLELCRQIKTAESTSHIPVVLLTARASTLHQVDGLTVGADAYISKPFNLQVLLLSIRNLLKSQEIIRNKFTEQIILQPSNVIISTPDEKFIQKLMQIIGDQMDDPEFDVNTLVTEIGMSRTVLYKKVQTLTNFTVADLIKYMRLQKAASLLQSGSFPVAEVAYLVGFNDRKHFSREFKKQYKVSPSVYQGQGKINR